MGFPDKNRLKWASLALLGAVAAVLLVTEVAAPWALRRWLVAGGGKTCEGCELSLGAVRFGVFPPSVSLVNARFSGGEPKATAVYAAADRIDMPVSIFSLLRGRPRVGRIRIEKPAVKVLEGDVVLPPSKTGDDEGFDFELEGIDVRSGAFTYVRNHLGRKGTLRISSIKANVGPVGTSERLRGEKAEGLAEGVLGRSGKFHLSVVSAIFEKKPEVLVRVRLAGQKLADLNELFHPVYGIRIEGLLHEGRSTVKARGRHLSSSAYALYEDLDVKIEKNEERGALAAFFMNLLAPIKMGKQNVTVEKKIDRTGTAELDRDPKRTFISFLLSGMQEAAMKVSSKAVPHETHAID